MSEQRRDLLPAEIVADVTTAADFGARRRRLGTFAARFSAALATEFAGRSRALTRREPVEADGLARLGLIVAEAVDDAPARALCHVACAAASILSAEFEVALAALDAATDADPGSQRRETQTLRVNALIHLERYDEAEQTGDAALALLEEHGDVLGQARMHITLADLAFRLDRPRAALARYRLAERLLPADAAPLLHAAIASNRANALQACNRFHAAKRQFERARAMFAAEGCDHTVAQVDYNAGYSEGLRGRYQDALHRFQRSEAEFERLGDARHLAHIALDRAEIHVHLNLPEDAENLALEAAEAFRDLGLEKERGQSLMIAGRAAELAERPADASQRYADAEEIFAQLGLVERRFSGLIQRAGVLAAAGDEAEVMRLADEAEALLERDANPLSRASLELLRARLDLARGDHGSARDRAERVADACRRIHAPWVQIEAHRIVGEGFAGAGRTLEGIAAFEVALDHLEHYRGGVPADEYMSAFLSGRFELYERTVDLLVGAGEPQRAFEVAERARSRALVDLLADRRASEQGAAPGRRVPPRVQHLRDRLGALYRRLFEAGAQPEERSARSIRAIRRQAAGIENRIAHLLRDGRLVDRQTRSLHSVEAPTVAEVQRDLEPGVTLVEFFLSRDRLFTFAVTRDDLHVVSQPATERELHHLLLRFHFHLSKFQHTESVSEELVLRATHKNLERLAAIVLTPIASNLTTERLVIVPHSVLHHLPFHALPWGDGWLADAFEVVYTPSAAVYAHCGESRPTATGQACVFGLPDDAAPEIEDEARHVAAVLESDQLYLRDDATFERLREKVREARVVHIATHGMFRPDQPMLSSIRLADKWVNLYDLYDLDVRGELVVLSTCESGTADVTRGDEILGLTRGFLYAGAPALLTSQWRVHDTVTTKLMASFYCHLRATGDASAALRAAMADIRREHPHPYFWAPFSLTGRPVAGGTAERTRAPTAAEEREHQGIAHFARVARGDSYEVLQ